jgi:hypothetical protein
VADERPGGTSEGDGVAGEGPREDRAYRRRFRDKGNKRDDWAIDVFREVFASFDDPDRVDRLLFDLSRYYNALADGPIVDMATRQRVSGLLRAGDQAPARVLLEECLSRYRGGIDDGIGRVD